ncbi:MAG: hypothetical protein AABX93_02145 [Nanoarchaeota archaeon]
MVRIKLIKKDERKNLRRFLTKHAGRDYTSLFLRIGLAFSFIYAAVSILLHPLFWVGFIPSFAEIFFPAEKIIYAHAVLDAVLGIWLLTNKKIFYASVLSAANVFLITAFNFGAMDIVFRDVTIFFSAVALAVLTKNQKTPKTK